MNDNDKEMSEARLNIMKAFRIPADQFANAEASHFSSWRVTADVDSAMLTRAELDMPIRELVARREATRSVDTPVDFRQLSAVEPEWLESMSSVKPKVLKLEPVESHRKVKL